MRIIVKNTFNKRVESPKSVSYNSPSENQKPDLQRESLIYKNEESLTSERIMAELRPGSSINEAGAKLTQELALGSSMSIIRFVDFMVECGHRLRASDIHIDPAFAYVRLRFRIDGVLQDLYQFPKSLHTEIISRVKILAGLRIDEHQSAQDGRFRINVENDQSVDVRVSVVPTYHGENAVLRLLSDNAEDYSLKSLGFSSENEKKILLALKKPYGMILTTGPTGSGKTTTMYTLIKLLNTKDVSIITIEDPIEYAISGINQIQVNERTNLTFANGLRHILRQDPNVIMVGEIRDAETAGLAVNTALTGHLMLSTLHTNDASTTLPRLLDMRIEAYLVGSTVNIAIGQRLVRRICEHCKAEKNLSENEIKSLSEIVPKSFLQKNKIFYFGKGCQECGHTGFKGRLGVHEVLVVDQAVRDAILEKVPASKIREIAIKQGMIPMIKDGLEKAILGLTTLEEVLRLSYE